MDVLSNLKTTGFARQVGLVVQTEGPPDARSTLTAARDPDNFGPGATRLVANLVFIASQDDQYEPQDRIAALEALTHLARQNATHAGMSAAEGLVTLGTERAYTGAHAAVLATDRSDHAQAAFAALNGFVEVGDLASVEYLADAAVRGRISVVRHHAIESLALVRTGQGHRQSPWGLERQLAYLERSGRQAAGAESVRPPPLTDPAVARRIDVAFAEVVGGHTKWPEDRVKALEVARREGFTPAERLALAKHGLSRPGDEPEVHLAALRCMQGVSGASDQIEAFLERKDLRHEVRTAARAQLGH